MRFCFSLWPALVVAALLAAPATAADTQPWKTTSNALVIDAYEMNIIDWEEMLGDSRIAAFVSKASDGLPESYSCKDGHRGDTLGHCRTMWRKYAVSRELYQTRRMLAKSRGLLWGAYHLARPGNPIDQANHFLDFAEPAEDEMMVIDIEDINADKFMSLEDADIFARHVKARTGRYPVLYTNHVTAKAIAANRDAYPVLARLPLWYARYKPSIAGVFPMGNWQSYALWQFSTMHNCKRKSCPYRVPGTLKDIDVNVVAMDRKTLEKTWPWGELVPEREPGDAATVLVAASSTNTDTILTGSINATARLMSPAADTGLHPAPRLKDGGIPIPVLSHRWELPEVAAYRHVQLPAMPEAGPRWTGTVAGGLVLQPTRAKTFLRVRLCQRLRRG
ncbi:GH25 family lysozyme [Hoeflea sp. G2-23]|uniref:GH25 family lysozyme n=1 Tax=Hoeflea algicola TaxID=2983763 RepID=A0ABT3ZFB9_9HYPH|nr:GH25 family lysozyme [Hoeflea algicola]MCY0150500.1 GH25 family lysozyme [Hoeflea algicola]